MLTGTSRWMSNRQFCSNECQYKHYADLTMYVAIAFFIISVLAGSVVSGLASFVVAVVFAVGSWNYRRLGKYNQGYTFSEDDIPISSEKNCRVCKRTRSNMMTSTSWWSDGLIFCSQNCKDAYLGRQLLRLSGVMGVMLLVWTIQNPSELAIVLLILILGIIVFGLYLQSLSTSTSRPERTGTTIFLEESESEYTDPQDQKIYSDILQTYVHPCCYQSARLNDKYCVCGRALEYIES